MATEDTPKTPTMSFKFGMRYGLESGQYCKKTNQWQFEIPGVCMDDTPGVDALPPLKSARPSLTYKEMEVRHLIEDVYYPAKPDWQPVTITLYDLKKPTNPIWNWLLQMYDPKQGLFYTPVRSDATTAAVRFIKTCYLTMYDGCGSACERWVYEDVWPKSANFQTLDMSQRQVLTCDLTLRYARAYVDA